MFEDTQEYHTTPKTGSDLFSQAFQLDSATPNRLTEIHLMNPLKRSNCERRTVIWTIKQLS